MKPLVELIDEDCVQDHNEPPRKHLGGSLIGRPCDRELWYSFRWAMDEKFEGRMLRLFKRGHDEEPKFIKLLRRRGIEVLEYSEWLMHHEESDSYMTVPARFSNESPTEPEIEAKCTDVTDEPFHRRRAKERDGIELKQWRILDVKGHFGGSLDGISKSPVEITDTGNRTIPANTKFLNEFKTHNSKSFVNLVNMKGGVKEAKLVHWKQMQIYMHKRELAYALYMAQNKNDDDLYVEVVFYDPAAAPEMIARAERIILAPQPPARLHTNPAMFDCKFCSKRPACHFAEPMTKSCRTCQFSSPVENGEWHCSKFNSVVPHDFMLKGCDGYKKITD